MVGSWTVSAVSQAQGSGVISGHFSLKALMLFIRVTLEKMKPGISLVFQTVEGSGNTHGNQFYYNTKEFLVATSFCQCNIKYCDIGMQGSRFWTLKKEQKY